MPSLRHACLVLLLCGSVSKAQTLAHPGWRGNGIAAEAWWKHAAFVRFDADVTFTRAAAALDTMGEADVDSMILPDLLPTGQALADAGGVSRPFDARFGTEEDLDALLREASARRMHVLLRADLLRLAGSPGELRFWMSRGIAGFDLGEVMRPQMDTLQLLQAAMNRFLGRRILLAHLPDDGVVRAANQDREVLHLVSPQGAATRTSAVQNAVEIHTGESLKTVSPGTTLVVDAALLASNEAREDLRQILAAHGTRAKTYPAVHRSAVQSGSLRSR